MGRRAGRWLCAGERGGDRVEGWKWEERVRGGKREEDGERVEGLWRKDVNYWTCLLFPAGQL